MDMSDIRAELLDEVLHLARLQRVPWGQGERADRTGGTRRILYLVLDNLVPSAPQYVRLGPYDGVLAARLSISGVKL
jgi:hypothetical protein